MTDSSAIMGRDFKGLTAREKKMFASSGDTSKIHENQERNGRLSDQETDSEWKSSINDVLCLKQSINFECSNSIPINFSEAWSYFKTCDMSPFMDKSERNPSVSHLKKKFGGLIGHASLNTTILSERDLIFAISACPMNNESSVHRRILQSIYVFLTKKPSCPRFGGHWEEVGFQGNDPASDLRGVGLFGALQLLYLSSSQETKEVFAPELFELSRHPIHQFPLAVLSLNVTRMSLDAFRDGILNKFCNKESSAIFVVNQFYLAILYRIYKKWKDNGMTIHDSCYLLKAVEKWCRAHPRKTLEKLSEYLGKTKKIVEEINRVNGVKKWRLRKKRDSKEEYQFTSLSWLDLTKPSLEVFI